MDLSIIIVNWNTRELVSACLDSVASQIADSQLDIEVWVIDNASTDGSLEMLETRYPWVNRIANPKNVGFAGGNNQGIEASAGETILLLNSDTVVRPGAIDRLFEFVRARPDVGAAGPRMLNADGSLQVSCYPAPTLFREFWRLFYLDKLVPLGVYDMSGWDLEVPRTVDNLLGACMLLRRDVVAQVGLMDESYFMFSEEIDWCQRIRSAGWKIFWVPGAAVVHYGGQSTVQARREMFIYLYRSKIMYFRKHFGRFRAVVYKTIIAAATLVRLVASPLAYLLSGAERKQKLLLASYYGQLLRALPGM